MSKLLSILIPTMDGREEFFDELIDDLVFQREECDAEFIVDIITYKDNGEMSIGSKRQKLLELANSTFISFVDDDDKLATDYVESVLIALESNPDVVGFNGYVTHDGLRRENFSISKDLPYRTIKDNFFNNFHQRHPNHLSPIRLSIAKQIGYNDLRVAEDLDYSIRLKQSGLIKTEVFINRDMYHYKFVTNKNY